MHLEATVASTKETTMKKTLGLTGVTVNAMALIAPGAFLWMTYQLQAANTDIAGKSTAGDMWTGIVGSPDRGLPHRARLRRARAQVPRGGHGQLLLLRGQGLRGALRTPSTGAGAGSPSSSLDGPPTSSTGSTPASWWRSWPPSSATSRASSASTIPAWRSGADRLRLLGHSRAHRRARHHRAPRWRRS